MTGEEIKAIMEDVADNLFHPDPYYRQGGDMVRVGGVSYAIAPAAKGGSRITDLRVGGKPMQADRKYRATGWASMMEVDGPPVFDVVANHLRALKSVKLDTRPRIRVKA
jgi:sulfur-oxidizing protein SoxB